MPWIAFKKILLHRHLTGRDYAALALLVIVLASFASTWIQYRHSQRALHIAEAARSRLRHDRKVTEIGLCRAVNLNREINNRDRQTLQRSVRQEKADLKGVTDPVLHALLEKSVAQSKHEVAIRPFLKPINCKKLVNNPTHTKVHLPGLTTTG